MSEQANNQWEQEGNAARVHRGSKLTAFQGKIKETDHVKKILAVAGAGVFLLVAVIIIHGPNKRHHDDQKSPSVVQDAPVMNLHAYQQEVEAAQRRRETGERAQAVQPAPADDPSDISFIKQTWRRPQIWDDGHTNDNGSAVSYGAASRYRAPQAAQSTSDDVLAIQREKRLQERLDAIRARQAALLRQREEASQ